MSRRVVAVVPAAGIGARFGQQGERKGGLSKQFVLLGGSPVIVRTCAVLARVEAIEEIIPVFKEEERAEGMRMLAEHGVPKVRRSAPGGKERHDSVRNALELIEAPDSTTVLIHDAARPLVTEDIILRTLEAAEGADGAIACHEPVDTIKEVDREGFVTATHPRASLRMVQTPQVFSLSTLMEAHRRAREEGFVSTDDAALIEHYGGRVKTVIGSRKNIKITTPEDLRIAEIFFEEENLALRRDMA